MGRFFAKEKLTGKPHVTYCMPKVYMTGLLQQS